jgi:hypothetical protein
MKILFVSHFFPPLRAIASIRTYGWARSWADMGHEVHVLTSAKYAFDGPQDLDLPVNNIHVHAVPYPWDSGRGAADRASSRRCLLAWSAWMPAPRPIIGRVS